ncbi:UDP-N-acetyl-D-glucosamine dehydrogenase [Candidatus Desantisbacteria bacterium CG_4_10_14_0_8_um_filter_48_22]|uniref:UDP-N-acetyl-D-glucosamine dehydrogenase n=1 Tax=Candidatus Desantisbacteria bacterium CG_4_10_14_0_8_um_filter_48_22 TaxID=1974543 RepID=A0A2M7S8Y0_9BACT|nr:MAG: UDP-N-acetyl-D-glucosamine dehydrogenase [Candidatus Desantisbacteria bacterium CG1_02_49_89]PIV54480.1 MAG: UDP-N-acetyl-D-glucosamine dehydrogenase [Candidatus Desantisbacteria bacterium CG02_land_8_20_14_3_00_49_13]PIZ15929.1 MAG: UDP-N-acetyl-D-glucosamine dehydrogenase [Candidatus Desantisbacteria bacterium CG_4_10_14_0_8_um_filter_48_22]PJB27528.1 MAG: UDP-N-acetyl-D-glucosamine dehydrogenase [Candidatus Desantisbacteria bacterium CG_4_9_14_3_um_filter_50_7]
MLLKEKILSKKAKVCIIGLGYVGLPEAVAAANAGFRVFGFDLDKTKVNNVNRGKLYISDIEEQDFKRVIRSGALSATTDPRILSEADVICVAVPTPFNVYKEPDLSYVLKATEFIAKNSRKGQLVILESTTYPGTTREVMLPVLKKKEMKPGRDFFLAFSPERIDPGNSDFHTTNTPKVAGGITPRCTEMVKLFYSQFIIKVIPVSSPEVAELTKLLENIFRNVNIALVNELMLLCDRMKINIWEVVEAAKTKPFGFMSFMPGPGVGGHCIPVDPVYLSWKAKEFDFHTRFIELAAEVNSNMPYYVVSKVNALLRKKSPEDSTVLVLGVAFKKGISDMRNSPSLKIMDLMQKEGFDVLYNDPYVPSTSLREHGGGKIYRSSKLTSKLLRSADCVVVVTDHPDYDYEWIARHAKCILDTRNALKGVKGCRDKIVRL